MRLLLKIISVYVTICTVLFTGPVVQAAHLAEYKPTAARPIPTFEDILPKTYNPNNIGPGVLNYDSTLERPSEEEELKDIDCPVKLKDRVFNYKGCCCWSSIQLCGNYAEIKSLYGITNDVDKGGDRRCQGGSDLGTMCRFLDSKGIKYDSMNNKDINFFVKWVHGEHRPCCFFVPGHCLNIVSIRMDEGDGGIVKIIDNADRSLAVQTWTVKKFMGRWTGGGLVIFGDPDIVPFKFNPWTLIPIINQYGLIVRREREFFPLPL